MTPDHHAHVLPLRYQLGQAIMDGNADRQAALRRYVDRYVTWWIRADCYRTTRRAWRTTP